MNHCLVFCLSEGKRRAKSVEQAVQQQPLPFVSPPPTPKTQICYLGFGLALIHMKKGFLIWMKSKPVCGGGYLWALKVA